MNDEAARQGRSDTKSSRALHFSERGGRVNRCHVCERPCVREVEPAFGELPAALEPDVWRVVIRNGLLFDVCHSCWMLWPDPWKHFPEVGFGRWPAALERAGIREDELAALPGGPS